MATTSLALMHLIAKKWDPPQKGVNITTILLWFLSGMTFSVCGVVNKPTTRMPATWTTSLKLKPMPKRNFCQQSISSPYLIILFIWTLRWKCIWISFFLSPFKKSAIFSLHALIDELSYTSLFVVNVWSKIASVDIHFKGSFLFRLPW